MNAPRIVCKKTMAVSPQTILIRAFERSSERTGFAQKQDRTSARLPATTRKI